jgi:hypothetical protein
MVARVLIEEKHDPEHGANAEKEKETRRVDPS